MTSEVDKTKSISKNIQEWLSIIGGIAVILSNFLSLLLLEKTAKQLSFGLAVLFLLGTFWYQRKKTKDIKIPANGPKDKAVAANRLLKSYLAVYKNDSSLRIPINRVRWFQKYSSQKLQNEKEAAELIRASELTFYWILGTNIFLAIILTVTLYAFLTTNYTFNPVNFFFGHNIVQKENPFIFLDNGKGTMIFGTHTPDPGGREQKIQTIPINDFSIQQTEVTNKQYWVCRSSGGCQSDPAFPKFYDDKEYANHPVVFVNASQAKEFCHWMGGDLPTSEEWERAARGLHGNWWPSWNKEIYPSDLAHLYARDVTGTVEVTKFPSDTTSTGPEGIRGLVGNVSEWTNSQFFKDDTGNRYIEVLDDKDSHAEAVIRGGSWTFIPTRITQVQVRGPDTGSESIGFRCVIHTDQP